MKEIILQTLMRHFEGNFWRIIIDGAKVEAEMSSGYGDGPAVIDLDELANDIVKSLE
jgi:hypothetical protein